MRFCFGQLSRACDEEEPGWLKTMAFLNKSWVFWIVVKVVEVMTKGRKKVMFEMEGMSLMLLWLWLWAVAVGTGKFEGCQHSVHRLVLSSINLLSLATLERWLGQEGKQEGKQEGMRARCMHVHHPHHMFSFLPISFFLDFSCLITFLCGGWFWIL